MTTLTKPALWSYQKSCDTHYTRGKKRMKQWNQNTVCIGSAMLLSLRKRRQVSHYILKVCFYAIKVLILLIISSLLLAYYGKINGRCTGTSLFQLKKQTIPFRILQYWRNAPIAHLVECMICLKYWDSLFDLINWSW